MNEVTTKIDRCSTCRVFVVPAGSTYVTVQINKVDASPYKTFLLAVTGYQRYTPLCLGTCHWRGTKNNIHPFTETQNVSNLRTSCFHAVVNFMSKNCTMMFLGGKFLTNGSFVPKKYVRYRTQFSRPTSRSREKPAESWMLHHQTKHCGLNSENNVNNLNNYFLKWEIFIIINRICIERVMSGLIHLNLQKS